LSALRAYDRCNPLSRASVVVLNLRHETSLGLGEGAFIIP
jgi:hypothetical protein